MNATKDTVMLVVVFVAVVVVEVLPQAAFQGGKPIKLYISRKNPDDLEQVEVRGSRGCCFDGCHCRAGLVVYCGSGGSSGTKASAMSKFILFRVSVFLQHIPIQNLLC